VRPTTDASSHATSSARDLGRSQSAARVAMVLQTLFSGGTYLFVKSAVGDRAAAGPLTPRQLMTLRFAATLALLLGFVVFRPRSVRVPWARLPKLAFLGVLAVPVNVGLFFEGAQRAPTAHPALFYALTPVFVFVIEWAGGRTAASARRVLGLLLALLGAAVVLSRGTWATFLPGGADGEELFGDFLLLSAAVSWAFYTTLSRPLVTELGAVQVMVTTLSLGSLIWLPIGVPLSAPLDLGSLPASAWISVAYLALLTSVINYSLWLFALKRLEPTQVAVFSNLQPAITVLFVWMVRGEAPTLSFLVGTVAVLSGVTFVQRAKT